MKPASEWNEEYVINLPPGEYDWVEFKGTHALDFSLAGVDQNRILNELSVQLSAFANSGGGTIVYGISDAPAGQTRQVDLGGVSLSLKGRSTKEWLEDVIPNQVDYPLNRFNVYPVINTAPGSNILAGRGIFLVSIPDSEDAPHQAHDKKYYARVGGKSRPIGHRMVMDIVGRLKYPRIAMSFKLVQEKRRIELEGFCRNTGNVYANYINGFVFVPKKLTHRSSRHTLKEFEGKEYWEIFFSNVHKDLINYKSNYSISVPDQTYYITRYDPLLPRLGFGFDIPLMIINESLPLLSEEELIWTAYADNAPPQEGRIKISEIKVREK